MSANFANLQLQSSAPGRPCNRELPASDCSVIPRGKIREFREHLNTLCSKSRGYRNFNYRQRTRAYGDYLYHQDRDKFMVELREWLTASQNDQSLARRASGSE